MFVCKAVYVQIYSGYMERKFVPVEKRGGGDAIVDSDVPAHLRNDFPHSGHIDAKTKDNGRGKPSCLSKFTS